MAECPDAQTADQNTVRARSEMIKDCLICFGSDDLRVLHCGHIACLQCLVALYHNGDSAIRCPIDREGQDVEMQDVEPPILPTIGEFQGKLVMPTHLMMISCTNINDLLDSLPEQRLQTIADLAMFSRSFYTKHEKTSKGALAAKIGGTTLKVVGIIMQLAGLGHAGHAVKLAGACICLASAVTKLTVVTMESRPKTFRNAADLSKSLNRDIFISDQIKAILSRAAKDAQFATEWGINQTDADYFFEIIPRMPKKGFVTYRRIRKLFPKDASNTDHAKPGTHIAGLIFAASSLPIAQMYVESKKIRTKQPVKVINDLVQVFLHLRRELQHYFLDGGYLKLVYSSDSHWAYVIISAAKIGEFRRCEGQKSYTLAEIGEMGFVIHSGKGDKVPEKVQQEIQKLYDHHDDFLAEIYQDSEQEGPEATGTAEETASCACPIGEEQLEIQDKAI